MNGSMKDQSYCCKKISRWISPRKWFLTTFCMVSPKELHKIYRISFYSYVSRRSTKSEWIRKFEYLGVTTDYDTWLDQSRWTHPCSHSDMCWGDECTRSSCESMNDRTSDITWRHSSISWDRYTPIWADWYFYATYEHSRRRKNTYSWLMIYLMYSLFLDLIHLWILLPSLRCFTLDLQIHSDTMSGIRYPMQEYSFLRKAESSSV